MNDDDQLRRDLSMIIDFWVLPHVDYRAIDDAIADTQNAVDNIMEMLKEKGILPSS